MEHGSSLRSPARLVRRDAGRDEGQRVRSQRTEDGGQRVIQQAVSLSVISYSLFGRSVAINCLGDLNDLTN